MVIPLPKTEPARFRAGKGRIREIDEHFSDCCWIENSSHKNELRLSHDHHTLLLPIRRRCSANGIGASMESSTASSLPLSSIMLWSF